ncbi:MAG: prolyl oligopeptidase family serine peptidase [Rikenellaceae bacterium]
MSRTLIIFALTIFSSCVLSAQTEKKLLTVDDLVKWNRITEKKISDDGRWVATKYEPWKGVSLVKLFDNKGKEHLSADSATNINFSPDSKFLIFKKGDSKKESLYIFRISDKTSTVIDSIQSFQLPEKWRGLIVYQTKDSVLTISTYEGKVNRTFEKVSGYFLAKERTVALITTAKGVLRYDAEKRVADTIMSQERKVLKSAISEDGQRVALLTKDTIFLWGSDSGLKSIVTKKSNGIHEGWRLSADRELKFTKGSEKLYFGTAPALRQRDSSVSEADFPMVNIWHWKEKIQFTQQVVDKKNELNRSYLAVYNIQQGSIYQIANQEIPEVTLIDEGNSDFVLATSSTRFQLEEMWEGRSRYDVYLINTVLGRSSLIKEALLANVLASPSGKYLFWYSDPDSSWFTYSIAESKISRITDPKSIKVFDEENDLPDWPASYSFAGWTKEDKEILICDRYDIWSVDPLAKRTPERITRNGRESSLVYRIIKVDEEDRFVDTNENLLLSGFNEKTKGSGYYSLETKGGGTPKELISGLFMLSEPLKAKRSRELIYTVESFEQFPDLYLSDLSFKKPLKITNANPQQNEYNWGTAELVKWVSLDGRELEGVIYKPADFDLGKKYPMVVNFYEKNSSTLFSHRTPEAHRSTIDYHLYTSNGYVIFNPDIVYREGYPGESAYNCIMPGITMIINMGYSDKNRIGAQGHSWGGYQVAYLATKTTLFAAIESGAPVVNMFSAYGGIRWSTGKNRSFQYEHQQSRIGKTPWGAPLRYFENSPLFSMDKVQTPILIMHNDEDGHVPWYQGIEYFVALKRLQKPVWLLNYTGEIHWPQKLTNKVDFQKRMFQFFNHYLKGEPMPKWMEEGLSAIDLDYELGY